MSSSHLFTTGYITRPQLTWNNTKITAAANLGDVPQKRCGGENNMLSHHYHYHQPISRSCRYPLPPPIIRPLSPQCVQNPLFVRTALTPI